MRTYLLDHWTTMPAKVDSDNAPAAKDDLTFVRRIADGDPDAAAAVYERHGGLVYRFSLRLSKDKCIAEDVTQEVFLALVRQASDFDAKRGELSTWLCGIARNLVWKHLRSSQRWGSLEDDNDVPSPLSTETNAYDAMERSEMSSLLWRCIEDLPPLLREVLVLCEFEELSYQATAAVTMVPLGTVRSRLSRAKARLARSLRENVDKAKGGMTNDL
jgi:RNA polymerase sigma-70 factor, ECF subfamily